MCVPVVSVYRLSYFWAILQLRMTCRKAVFVNKSVVILFTEKIIGYCGPLTRGSCAKWMSRPLRWRFSEQIHCRAFVTHPDTSSFLRNVILFSILRDFLLSKNTLGQCLKNNPRAHLHVLPSSLLAQEKPSNRRKMSSSSTFFITHFTRKNV
jgi:hypothetical protein